MARDLTTAEQTLAASLPDGDVLAAFATKGLPSRRDEAWKWSDLRAALKVERHPSAGFDYEGEIIAPLAGAIGPELIIANGLLRAPADIPHSIRISRGEAEPVLWPDALVASLTTVSAPTQIEITETLDAPLCIRRLSSGNGYHADSVIINVAEGVSLTLVETHHAQDAPFANSTTLINLGTGASVERIIIQPKAADAVLIHSSQVLLYDGARFAQTSVCGGAAFARHDMQLTHSKESEARIDGLYRLSGATHHDFTTLVTHMGPDAQTDELVKGIIDDRARGIFQGKFFVDQQAQRTDSKMSHRALLLSDTASVNAKPELEIYADDVECAHGNTAGALDDDALFYLQQRGLSADDARRLLIDAFAADVLDRVENDALREALTEFVTGGAA